MRLKNLEVRVISLDDKGGGRSASCRKGGQGRRSEREKIVQGEERRRWWMEEELEFGSNLGFSKSLLKSLVLVMSLMKRL